MASDDYAESAPQSEPSKIDIAREMVFALKPLVKMAIIVSLLIGVPYAIGAVILHFYPPSPDSVIATGMWADFNRWSLGIFVVISLVFSFVVLTEWYRTARERAREKVDNNAQ